MLLPISRGRTVRCSGVPVSRCLLAVAKTLDAVCGAITGARQQLRMEYYTFEDVHWCGRSLVDLLVEKLEQGVQVALSYDGAGSQATDDRVFERLRRAGAVLLEFRPLSPLRQRFNPFKVNDRDHRKLLVADGVGRPPNQRVANNKMLFHTT
jgi:cardiolipin synthase